MAVRKYRNQPTEVDGVKFSSKKEAARYKQLKLLEKAGQIHSLTLQPRYPITVCGLHICTYVADFEYFDVADVWRAPSGEGLERLVTEDVKGVKTSAFIIKAKLFHALYGREVTLT